MTGLRPELIPAHRRALMLEHLKLRGAASIGELAMASGASPSTVRRDLEHLEEQGFIARTHGGAMIQNATPASTFEPEAGLAAHLARAEKRAIGRAAAANLRPGQSVIFDSSSTVLMAAQAAVERDIPLTAVTNDLGIGQVLATASQIRLVVLGGTLRPGSLTLTGEPGQDFLKGLRADVALLGIHAISDTALSDTSIELAAMKRAIIAAARRIVLLADGSKFQPAAFSRICDVTAVHELITDEGAQAGDVARLRDAGLAVTLVGVDAAARRAA